MIDEEPELESVDLSKLDWPLVHFEPVTVSTRS